MLIETSFPKTTDEVCGNLNAHRLEILDVVAELGKVNSAWRFEATRKHKRQIMEIL